MPGICPSAEGKGLSDPLHPGHRMLGGTGLQNYQIQAPYFIDVEREVQREDRTYIRQ